VAFNSVTFLLVFLPVVLLLYHGAARWLPDPARLLVLIAAGLVFYGRSGATYLPLLLGSALFNYALAVGIARSPEGAGRRTALVWLGVAVDIGLLLYFKYFGAVFNSLAGAFGRGADPLRILTPLAISFYTFQQVAFLLDVARGRTAVTGPVRYLAFVSFFPQLLAGPISLHQEVDPQLARPLARGRALENILIGLVIFALGLFKKTVIADTAALWADPVFDGAAAGAHPDLLTAWAGAITYTLQIYFDFSGYSDMAIGVARMFGILLPLNFFSPFRSRSIAELWQRWHMTLGRWVRLYIFQPMAVPLTRLAATRGLGKWSGHSVDTLVPLFISMLVIGTWHGPNWTYVLFGLMHGTFQVINEVYNFATRKARRKKPDSPRMLALYTFLTVLAFTLAEVPFRSVDLPTTGRVFGGMIGLSGFGPSPSLSGAYNVALIVGMFLIVYLLPNTEQIMDRVKPALAWERWGKVDPAAVPLRFRFSPAWAAYAATALFLGLAFISRGSGKFIYFNF
jgi:alginate O-acetyltransferase complex protein AlgI